jgi:hypothetical protein
MIESDWPLIGGVLPVLVGVVALMVWLQPWRPLSRYSTALGWAVATADGFWVGYFLLLGRKGPLPVPPIEASHWLGVVLLPALVLIEAVALIERVPRWLAWAQRLLTLAAVPVLISPAFLQGRSPTAKEGAELVVIIVIVLSVRALLGLLAARTDARAPWWPLLIAAGGAGVLILSSGSVTTGQSALTLAAAMLGVRIASVFIKGPMPLQAGLGVGLAMLAGLLLTGYWYAEVKLTHGVLILLIPLAGWVALAPKVRDRPRWQAALVAAVLAAIVAGAVVGPVALEAKREAETDLYEGMY